LSLRVRSAARAARKMPSLRGHFSCKVRIAGRRGGDYAAPMNRADLSLFSAVVAAPFGAMGVRVADARLRELVYLPPSFPEKAPVDALSEEAARQLQAYFSNPDHRFDLPLAAVGTPFQQRVWQIISSIPRGEVLTYGQVARELRSAPRAVGQACGNNWFALVIPCHRVTAANGLGGFAHSADQQGFLLKVKRWLLAHEDRGLLT
jgi:methylated-DNA-[protein]-cysteine S-methyltransferase